MAQRGETTRIWTDGTTQYVGTATCGSAETAALWSIQQIETDATGTVVATRYASGTIDQNKIWTDRTTLTYS